MITIKSQEEIKIMREGGKILAQILADLAKRVEPGITTNYLENIAQKLMEKFKVKPSFFNYKPYGYKESYPAALCASINEEIVHAIPSERQLKDGDILSLDLGIWHKKGAKSLCVDAAITVAVGKVSNETLKLIEVTKKSLNIGIDKIRDGVRLGDIGFAIQNYVESQNFKVVRDLGGHGVGYDVHEDPVVPNFGKKNKGAELKEGMTLCVEPMVVSGLWQIKLSDDGFGYSTVDGSLSAHFEHTVAVTKNGAEVLTKI